MLTLTVAWVLVNVLLQGATPQQSAPAPPSAASSTPSPVTNWKVALMAGDDSIPAFDDARKTLKEILLQDGISADHIKELSMDPAAQVDGVLPGGYANLLGALDSLNIGGGDSCLVYMTSHGNRQGFAIKNNPPLTPAALNSIVEHS